MLFADVQNASKHALSVLGVNYTGWTMVKFTGALSMFPATDVGLVSLSLTRLSQVATVQHAMNVCKLRLGSCMKSKLYYLWCFSNLQLV